MYILKFECAQCKEVFEKTKRQSSHSRNIFCSVACERKNRKKGKDKNCDICGKLTYVQLTRLSDVNFCSKSCATIHKHKFSIFKTKTNINAIDWEACQKIHDSGVFFSKLSKELNISNTLLYRAVKQGLLKKHKYKVSLTEKEKINLSNKRKIWLTQNPDKHVWKQNSKFISVPCEKLKKFLNANNIKFEEEVTVSKTRNFAVDILIPDKNLIIEVNGNQHYNTDGTLKKYYQERHDHIKNLGWTIIELHYTLVFDHELILSLINDTELKTQILPFIKIVKKNNRKYGNRSDYRKISKIKYDTEQQKYISLILNSEIDFSIFGWVNKVSKILNQPTQKINSWILRYMPDFYEQKCFKRKVSVNKY